MEVIKGVISDIPFFVPKFIFYIKRRNLLNINIIHLFYNFLHINVSKFDTKKRVGNQCPPVKQTY